MSAMVDKLLDQLLLDEDELECDEVYRRGRREAELRDWARALIWPILPGYGLLYWLGGWWLIAMWVLVPAFVQLVEFAYGIRGVVVLFLCCVLFFTVSILYRFYL